MRSYTNVTIKKIVLIVLISVVMINKMQGVSIPDSIVQTYTRLQSDSNRCDYLISLALSKKGTFPKLSFDLASKALFYAEQSNYIQGMCRAFNILGSIKCDIGEYVTAIDYHSKAYDRAKFLNDPELLSETFNYMGNVFYIQRKYTKAIEYYKESLKYGESSRVKTQMLGNLYKLGLIYETLDNYNDAYRCYKRSLLIEEEQKNKEGMFYSLMGIASVSAKKGDYAQSFLVYNRAFSIAKELNVLSYQSLCYARLGDLAKIQQKYVEASNYYAMALKIADSLEFYKDKSNCYYNLAYTNEKLKFYKEAYNYLTRYVEINDTLYNAEVNEQVSRMQMRFDLKNKENEIELLKQKEEQHKLERNYFIIGFISLTIFLLLLIYLYRIRQKNARLLKKQYVEIDNKQKELSLALEQLNTVNQELKKTNDQLTDGLIYAASLQQILMPFEKKLVTVFPNSFIFNKPKSMVSGDFAWFYNTPSAKFIVVADCTGHGLAGALVSIKGYNLCRTVIKDNHEEKPAVILNKLNEQWKTSFSQQQQHALTIEDSMDIILVKYHPETHLLEYASANQRFVIIREQATPLVLDGSIYSVGATHSEEQEHLFENKSVTMEPNDTLYFFTDGFADQFGENNQKMMFNSFLEHLKSLSKYPIQQQQQILSTFFNSWKGNKPQTDDILVLGLKFQNS